jgi:hypothetical protein
VFAKDKGRTRGGRACARSGQVAVSNGTPGARGPFEASAVTDRGRFVLADPTPRSFDAVWRTITAEFASPVRGESRQIIDVWHGVRIQRLIAGVAMSSRSADPARRLRRAELARRYLSEETDECIPLF